MAAVFWKQQPQQDTLQLGTNTTGQDVDTMPVSTRNPPVLSGCSANLRVSDNDLENDNTTPTTSKNTSATTNNAVSNPDDSAEFRRWATPTLAFPQTTRFQDDTSTRSAPANTNRSTQLAPGGEGGGGGQFRFHTRQPSQPELRLRTDVAPAMSMTAVVSNTVSESIQIPKPRSSAKGLSRSNSFQSSFSLSPNSAAGSPSLSAYTYNGGFNDITPLPSPVISDSSPGPWRLLNRTGSYSSRPSSRGSLASTTSHASLRESTSTSSLGYGNGDIISTPTNVSPPQTKRKAYQGIGGPSPVPAPDFLHLQKRMNGIGVSGNRSVSEHISTSLEVPHQHNHMVETHSVLLSEEAQCAIKREAFLAGKHGYPAGHIRSPPTSHAGHRRQPSKVKEDKSTSTDLNLDLDISPVEAEVFDFTAKTYPGNNKRYWRSVKLLGQGTFSRVMLATSESNKVPDDSLNPERLVAIKIIENGAAGGASKARIESSLKRELDILKSIKHPSLVHLKAFGIESERALLVLTYCPGGDLFDVATAHMKLLTPKLVRRIFAELVGALNYLHQQGIVHRDVKLENVLINIHPDELAVLDLATLPYYKRPIVTLTDLGLSRRIDFSDPMLTTRCGSEDYAAPEILLAQPYDGRQTDAWALGVLLYSLMESRLPFDPLPGTAEHKMRSRTVHRIARGDWKWVKLADPKNEEQKEAGVGAYDEEWKPAKAIVGGFLKRINKGRVSLEDVGKMEYVTGAILDGLEEPLDVEDL